MKLEDRHLQELTDDYADRLRERLDACERATSSPIEALMLWAFWHVCLGENEIFGMSNHGEVPSEIPDGSSVYVIRQAQIGTYRADFAVLFNNGGKIVVECDGHDFHEKTKAQAQHDKSRDRFMQDKGWRVFRFTGSEIYKSPLTCATSVLRSMYGASYV